MPNMSAILPGTSPARNPKLLDQVRDVLRRKHFSLRTEQAYVGAGRFTCSTPSSQPISTFNTSL